MTVKKALKIIDNVIDKKLDKKKLRLGFQSEFLHAKGLR